MAIMGGDQADSNGLITPDDPKAEATLANVYKNKPHNNPDRIKLFVFSDLINLTENGAAMISIDARKKGKAKIE